MEAAPLIARLWDHGWLGRDWLELLESPSDSILMERYVASRAFHSSFLPNDEDESGIHGPFAAAGNTAADFILLPEVDLEPYLEAVRLCGGSSDDAEARARVASHLRAAFQEGRRCYVLRFDETNRELFHEWGSVFLVFREFLSVDSARRGVVRFVVGYD